MENPKPIIIPERVNVFENIERETYGVILCIFCRTTGKFVILDRLDSRNRFKKSFPGGKRKPGEDAFTCAQREAWEETMTYIPEDRARAFPIYISRPFLKDKGSENPNKRARSRMYLQYYFVPVETEHELRTLDDSGKEINPEWRSLEEIQEFADQFLIYDIKSMRDIFLLMGRELKWVPRDAKTPDDELEL